MAVRTMATILRLLAVGSATVIHRTSTVPTVPRLSGTVDVLLCHPCQDVSSVPRRPTFSRNPCAS